MTNCIFHLHTVKGRGMRVLGSSLKISCNLHFFSGIHHPVKFQISVIIDFKIYFWPSWVGQCQQGMKKIYIHICVCVDKFQNLIVCYLLENIKNFLYLQISFSNQSSLCNAGKTLKSTLPVDFIDTEIYCICFINYFHPAI